jgi:hypothetical protein
MNYDATATLNILSALVAGLPAEKRAAARAIAFASAKHMLGLSDKQFGQLVAADVERLASSTDIEDIASVIERRLAAFDAYVKEIKPADAFGFLDTLWQQGVGRDGNPRTPLTRAQFGGSTIPTPKDAFAQFGL